MHAAFALTEIQPPRLRPGLIARPPLEQQLTVALGTARLVLVSAPAAFGKTAAITRQLARLPEGTAVAWIAADADDDLPRLAACLVAAHARRGARPRTHDGPRGARIRSRAVAQPQHRPGEMAAAGPQTG